MDTLIIEYGAGLEKLMTNTSSEKSGISWHLKELGRKHSLNFGFGIPAVTFRGNSLLEDHEYCLTIMGEEAGSGQILPDCMMAIPPKHNSVTLEGIALNAPLLDSPVTWIARKKTRKAESKGFSLVTPLNVLMQHLSASLTARLDKIFTGPELEDYIAQLPEKCKSRVADIVPARLSLDGLHKIFRMLLSEEVSIRDSGVILKAIREAAQTTQETDVITEHVRGYLARQITASHISGKGYLPLISLSEEWEAEFKKGLDQNPSSVLASPVQHAFQDSLGDVLVETGARGEKPVILTRASSRRAVKTLMRSLEEDIPVLSQNDIHADIELKTVGWIS